MRCLPAIFIFLLVFINAPAQSEKKSSKKAYLVTFHLKNGTIRSGIWHSSTDTTLLFYEQGKPITLFPEQVYKFEIRKSNSVKRNMLIGAGVGFCIGFIIGYSDDDADSRAGYARTGHASGVALLAAFGGAFVGHLTGMIGKTYYVLGSIEQYKKIQAVLMKYNQTTVP